MIPDAINGLFPAIEEKKVLNILEGTIKLVLKNLYVLQQIISFVGAAKGSSRYSECHHFSLRNHDKHRLVLVPVALE